MNLDKKIFELKKDHDDIFVTNIQGERFIYRPLTKYEYDELAVKSQLFETYKAEKICELCTLYPDSYDFYDPVYAGIPETLQEEILENSGFTSEAFVDEMLGFYRQQNQSEMDRIMENMIVAVFDQFTIEEVQDWNIYKLLDYFSRAEWIINNMRRDLVNPLTEDPQEQPQQAQQAQQQAQQMGPQTLGNNRI